MSGKSEENNTPNKNDDIRVPPRFGACVDEVTGVERCALAPSSCSRREGYRGAHATTQICLEKDVLLGRCISNEQRCAPSEDACSTEGKNNTKSDNFQELPSGSHCTLMKDTLGTQAIDANALPATIFPSCLEEEDHRCVIDASYCRPGEDLQPHAGLLQETKCVCQDVKVGLCYEQGLTTDQITKENSFCAVHSFDCPTETHRYLDGLHLSLFNCRLCDVSVQHSSLVGACVEGDIHAAPKVHQCAKQPSDCPLVTTRFFDKEELLTGYGMYCPASHVPPASVGPTPQPTLPPVTPTHKPTFAPTPLTTPMPTTTKPATKEPTTTTATSTATQNNKAEDEIFIPASADEQQLSAAAIYWIVIAGVFAFVAIVSLVVSYCWYRKRRAAVKKAAEFMNVEEYDTVDVEKLPEIE